MKREDNLYVPEMARTRCPEAHDPNTDPHIIFLDIQYVTILPAIPRSPKLSISFRSNPRNKQRSDRRVASYFIQVHILNEGHDRADCTPASHTVYSMLDSRPTGQSHRLLRSGGSSALLHKC
jgi:hypothetical protein